MRRFRYIIQNVLGIHARPAGMLMKEIINCKSRVVLSIDKKTANAANPMEVMELEVKYGQTVEVEISGEDEDTVYETVKGFFERNL